MSPTTRPDRRRADRAAARKTDEAQAGPGTQAGRAAQAGPASSARGAGFLNTLIIVLLVVLVVMIVAALLRPVSLRPVTAVPGGFTRPPTSVPHRRSVCG